MPQPSITQFRLTITCLKFHWNYPGANELSDCIFEFELYTLHDEAYHIIILSRDNTNSRDLSRCFGLSCHIGMCQANCQPHFDSESRVVKYSVHRNFIECCDKKSSELHFYKPNLSVLRWNLRSFDASLLNKACRPCGHWWGYNPGALSLSQLTATHWNTEYQWPDFIHGYPIFKWVLPWSGW